MIARLHVVTTDDIAAGASFLDHATEIMAACGTEVAVHLRMKRANARTLYEHASRLVPVARRYGSAIVVNERMDVAVAAGADGVQLTSRSLPIRAAIAMAARAARATHMDGTRVLIGQSVHSAADAASACGDGADYVILGTIWASGSHPGECGEGVAMIGAATERAACNVIAIGGVTPSRAQEALLAGAYGVAAISGVWSDPSPAGAALKYIESMQAVT